MTKPKAKAKIQPIVDHDLPPIRKIRPWFKIRLFFRKILTAIKKRIFNSHKPGAHSFFVVILNEVKDLSVAISKENNL
jgi:hypothetical protein